MPRGDVETLYRDGKWANRVTGERSEYLFQTKDRAVAAGRELARRRHVEHIIKNQDGTVAERNTYGDDPRDVRG
jgi:hypothetical protein